METVMPALMLASHSLAVKIAPSLIPNLVFPRLYPSLSNRILEGEFQIILKSLVIRISILALQAGMKNSPATYRTAR